MARKFTITLEDVGLAIDPTLKFRTFPLRNMVPTRSEDVNAGRHVSAIALMSILENERTFMLFGPLKYEIARTDGSCALVAIETNFLEEVVHPAKLEVATGIFKVGRTSFTFSQALFLDGACVGLSLAVYVNLQAARPAALSESLREAMNGQLIS